MKHIFFWILIFSSGVFCSPAQKPKTQSAECYVRYLVPEGQLLAEMTLREGPAGQKAQNAVVVPGGVQYQGIRMNELSSDGVSYQLNRASGYDLQHVFTWMAGKQRKFDMSLSPITAFSFGSDTLSRETPATFTWEGAPLERGETVVFLWETPDRIQTVPMEVIATPGQQSIEFPAVQVSKLSPGKWTLYLVRKKMTKANLEGTEVTGIAEYYTRMDTLLIR